MHTNTQRWSIALTLIGTLAGCTDESNSHTDQKGLAMDADLSAYVVKKDERVAFAPRNDSQFIDMMVPHHEMAVMMADRELDKGSSAEIKAMAQKMKDAQLAEIEQMKTARMEIAGSKEIPKIEDPHMEADMQKMEAAEGAALDRLFLEDMLAHHAGALQTSHHALANLKDAGMKMLAEKIIRDQSKEIGMIRDMLDAL